MKNYLITLGALALIVFLSLTSLFLLDGQPQTTAVGMTLFISVCLAIASLIGVIVTAVHLIVDFNSRDY